MDCQTCTDHMLSNTAAQCFSKQPNRSGGDKTSLTPSALLSTSKCSGILCIHPKPLAHHLTLIPHAAAHTCVCPRGAQCFRPCRGWEANPKAVGLVAELALTPQTQHEGHGQTPERLLGQIPTNINYFLTVADLCAIFYDSWKTCSSCKEQSVNLSKTRSGAAIVVKQKATNLSDKLHDTPIMGGLRLLLQRITHEDGTTGQETKPMDCYGFNHFTASN